MTWTRQPQDDTPLTKDHARQTFQKAMHDLLVRKNPGSIFVHLKPGKKANETYPLKLVQQQRESLVHCTRLKRGLKNKLANAEEGTQIVGVTRNVLN
jgi:hypothetical protein